MSDRSPAKQGGKPVVTSTLVFFIHKQQLTELELNVWSRSSHGIPQFSVMPVPLGQCAMMILCDGRTEIYLWNVTLLWAHTGNHEILTYKEFLGH